jgi:hypothetical protein
VFVGFSRIFLLGILIFKGLIARRLYKSFGIKGLTHNTVEKEKKIFYMFCICYSVPYCEKRKQKHGHKLICVFKVHTQCWDGSFGVSGKESKIFLISVI